MRIVTRFVKNASKVAKVDFYQQLKSVRDTIISLQYNEKDFLSFRVSQIRQEYFVGC